WIWAAAAIRGDDSAGGDDVYAAGVDDAAQCRWTEAERDHGDVFVRSRSERVRGDWGGDDFGRWTVDQVGWGRRGGEGGGAFRGASGSDGELPECAGFGDSCICDPCPRRDRQCDGNWQSAARWHTGIRLGTWRSHACHFILRIRNIA